MCRVGLLLLMVFAVVKCSNKDADDGILPHIDENIHKIIPLGVDEEYIRHIYSMIDAYRGDVVGGRLVIETNALIDTKYKTWKRNADIINSLLALPKGMNDAGR